MQIETTVRHHLTSVEMTVIKKITNKLLVGIWKKESHALLVDMYTGAATMENTRDSSES